MRLHGGDDDTKTETVTAPAQTVTQAAPSAAPTTAIGTAQPPPTDTGPRTSCPPGQGVPPDCINMGPGTPNGSGE